MRAALLAIVILGLGFSVFLAAYGIRGGLIHKRILNDARRKTYDSGSHAVRRGWFYIVLGVILFAIFTAALMTPWTE